MGGGGGGGCCTLGGVDAGAWWGARRARRARLLRASAAAAAAIPAGAMTSLPPSSGATGGIDSRGGSGSAAAAASIRAAARARRSRATWSPAEVPLTKRRSHRGRRPRRCRRHRSAVQGAPSARRPHLVTPAWWRRRPPRASWRHPRPAAPMQRLGQGPLSPHVRPAPLQSGPRARARARARAAVAGSTVPRTIGVASPVATIVGGAMSRMPRSAAAASRAKSPAEK